MTTQEILSNLLFLVKLILFTIGAIGVLRASPLDKIEEKPFSCNVCLGFWFSFIFTIAHSAFTQSDYLIDFFATITRAISSTVAPPFGLPVSAMVCLAVFLLRAVMYGFIGAGAVYIFTKKFPEFRRPKPKPGQAPPAEPPIEFEKTPLPPQV